MNNKFVSQIWLMKWSSEIFFNIDIWSESEFISQRIVKKMGQLWFVMKIPNWWISIDS